MGFMGSKRFSAEVRERAVRMVFEHQAEHGSQWATILSVAPKIGCTGASLHRWVTQAKRDQGTRAGLSTSERDRLKDLERENVRLKRLVADLSLEKQVLKDVATGNL
jgi:transposase